MSGHVVRWVGIILAERNSEICQLEDGGVMGNNGMDLSEVSAGSGSRLLARFGQ
jgi:hypothetical protein